MDKKIEIECKLGLINCYTDADIEDTIKNCATPLDDIWIYRDANTQYPCLSVQVNEEKAVVHYFTTEQDGHFQSEQEDNTGDTLPFLVSGEIWEAPISAVISLAKAIRCVQEFHRKQDRPSCIAWLEL